MADRDVLINENTMIAIANAIRNKSNSQTAYTPAQMPAAINQISGGSGGGSAITVTDTVDSHGGIIKTINAVNIGDTTATAGDVASGKYFYTADGIKTIGTAGGGGYDEPELKDVIFVDNEKVVYSYSKDEFLALESMPANPQKTGLVAQGWNWTLANAKAFVQTCGFLCIGQNYKTDDNSTRLYMSFDEYTFYPVTLRFNVLTLSGSMTVDWGDGTQTSITTTGAKAENHTYQSIGDYVIRLISSGTTTYFLGYNGSNNGVLNSGGNTIFSALALKKVELGEACIQIARQGFTGCDYATSISIPTSCVTYGIGTSGNSMINAAFRTIVLPPSVTLIGYNHFPSSTAFLSFNTASVTENNMNVCFTANNSYIIAGYIDNSSIAPAAGLGLKYFALMGNYTAVLGYAGRKGTLCRKVVIPSSVTSVADYSFTNYYADIHLLPTSPPTLAKTRGVGEAKKIYVPYSADHSILTAYQEATN